MGKKKEQNNVMTTMLIQMMAALQLALLKVMAGLVQEPLAHFLFARNVKTKKEKEMRHVMTAIMLQMTGALLLAK